MFDAFDACFDVFDACFDVFDVLERSSSSRDSSNQESIRFEAR